jgi:hypothetical protein
MQERHGTLALFYERSVSDLSCHIWHTTDYLDRKTNSGILRQCCDKTKEPIKKAYNGLNENSKVGGSSLFNEFAFQQYHLKRLLYIADCPSVNSLFFIN